YVQTNRIDPESVANSITARVGDCRCSFRLLLVRIVGSPIIHQRINLNRTDNTFLDFDSSIRTEQFKTRFGRAMRLTVAVNHPAGHKRAVPNLHGRYLAFDRYAATTNH